MPQLIQHIDTIARAEGRTVLYIIFHDNALEQLDWKHLPVRSRVIAWLDAHAIGWCACGHVANRSYALPYRGQIYIDVAFDKADPVYSALHAFLVKPDGSTAQRGAHFCYYPITEALKNADHDTPGFWADVAADPASQPGRTAATQVLDARRRQTRADDDRLPGRATEVAPPAPESRRAADRSK